jgi:3-phosphoshikimate 1-carboxyvinyltransferase
MSVSVTRRKEGLKGIYRVPGDKSIPHRAVMLGAIADGDTHVTGFLNGADCTSTNGCFRAMGVDIDYDGGTEVTVFSVVGANESVWGVRYDE